MSAGESPSAMADPNDPLLAQVIADRYRVLRKLGEGGMGSVYLAEHVVLEKKMALKILAPDFARRPELVARFLQEARSASRIGHENVIDISDFGQSGDGHVYIAMEFLDGKDLGEIVRTSGALPWEDTREITLQICRALRAAHDKGIVHRDMKPENIFLVAREDRPRFVKILDFGIAKVMGLDPQGPRLTRTGMIFGTPEYMAPEQAEGKDTDHRVDVYAVGCLLYHLITGQTPFLAESFMTMLTKHLMEDPVPPSVRRPDLRITPEMDFLVLKALEKNRDTRWQSMAELLEAVANCPGPVGEQGALSRTGTRELGGAHATAGQPYRREPNDEMVMNSVDRLDEAAKLPIDEFTDRPLRPSRASHRAIYIVLGCLLGVGAGIWLLLSQRSTAPLPGPEGPNLTSTLAAPLPAYPAPKPAAAAPSPIPAPGEKKAASTQGETDSSPVHRTPPLQHSRKGKPTGARWIPPTPADEPPPAPSRVLPPVPRELKPFPTQ